jgi:peptidoglycan/LPS O-acetylase OafA/YrhL
LGCASDAAGDPLIRPSGTFSRGEKANESVALSPTGSKLLSHWASSAIALAALGFSLVYREPWFRESFVYTLQSLALMPVFALVIRSHHRWPFRFLNWYPMRLIGIYSYRIYLTHLAVLRFLGLGQPGQFAITFLIAMTGSFFLSAMMYYYVDQPCAALRKRYTS